MNLFPSSLARSPFKLRAYDVAAAAFAPGVAMVLRDPTYFDRNDLQALAGYSLAAAAAAVMSLAYFDVGRLTSRYLAVRDLMQIAKAAAAAVAMTLLIMFSATAMETIPRSLPGLHLLTLVAFWAGARAMRGHWQGRLRRSDWRAAEEGVILVGVTELAALYLQMRQAVLGPRARVVALLDDDPKLRGRTIHGHIVLGPVSMAGTLVQEYAVHGVRVNRIILAFTDADREAAARRQIETLEGDVHVDSLADVLGVGPPVADTSEVAPSAPPALDLRRPYWRWRRLVDIVGASVAIVVLSPLLALGALLTWLDVGAPVIFWQERAGRRGKKIRLHKFRTLGPALGAGGRLLGDEERLSRLGRLMRATRLDELPQLFDVVRGHMSLIGPRPLLPIDLPEDPSVRLSVRPGLTGWAQVHGGKAVTAEDKAALDEWYIHHASPWLDLQIVWLTFKVALRTRDVLHSERVQQALAFRTSRRQSGVEADIVTGEAVAASDHGAGRGACPSG